LANLRLLPLVTKAIFYLKKGVQLINFGAERFTLLSMCPPAIRCNPYVPNPGTYGFSLLSGLRRKIWLFYNDPKKRKTIMLITFN
jgi:hypothetical protein